jgi:putative membrane protein
MIQTLVSLLISTLAALAAAYILPGVALSGFVPALIVAIILGILNALLFPILLVVTIPLNIITLGLFTFVIMGFLVWITSLIVPGFHVNNFWWCMLYGAIFAIINFVIREVF